VFYDSPGMVSYALAVGMGRALQDRDYPRFKDALPADEVYGYVRLKQQTHVPIMGTEETVAG
jgi:L-alanine-DL-glutamate epimerase-like enolase superfamily enzyme